MSNKKIKKKKLEKNYNKIFKELKKRGIDDFNNNGYTHGDYIALEWNSNRNYVCIRIRKNRVFGFCGKKYNKDSYRECEWDWKFWLSGRIVRDICRWIEKSMR